MKTKLLTLLLFIALVSIGLYFFARSYWVPIVKKVTGKKTTTDVIATIGDGARQSLTPYFEKAGIHYPPLNITFIALKKEHQLELWVNNSAGNNIFIRDYKIQKLSGKAGPKLREGDHQVPEGFYKITGLNPNSAYHLSMKLDYPNLYDLQNARKEGRTRPGSNIFIHGNTVSIGCLAMGDKTIEELFTLVNDVGINNSSIIISPHDPRIIPLQCKTNQPKWVCDLYWRINNRITLAHKR